MATIDIWIQLENRAWDVAPHWPINRSNAEGTVPIGTPSQVVIKSPITGATRTIKVQRPLPGDALILRRYTENWARPDDRKVNPWDLNEPDPTDAGTMGTIPGPTIECKIGDVLRVHFRNLDLRLKRFAAPWENPANVELFAPEARTHSLHAHGVTFASKFDGAYPLTPPDPEQPIPKGERALWESVGAKSRFKQGDRVPPGANFTYVWEARGAASAGVWSYHDHSICDMENLSRGAIGFIVVRNPADTESEVEITAARLPGGSWTGSPLDLRCMPLGAVPLGVLPGSLEGLGELQIVPGEPQSGPRGAGIIARDRLLKWGDVHFELNKKLTKLKRVCFKIYRQPPDQALYLLLFHEMAGVGMCVNGRKYLGNAPTLVAGPKTRMRFGVLGMGETFHTFHIHSHRWVVRGPAGSTAAKIEESAQVAPVSQFEDTKVFGPGSSFALTIEEGKGLMRADPPIGEWHMHCHVPMHMMDGMVGSLLVVNGGEAALTLPVGRECPLHIEEPAPPTPSTRREHQVRITGTRMEPERLTINRGDYVRWINADTGEHTVRAFDLEFDSPVLQPNETYWRPFLKAGTFLYDCRFHRHYWQFPPDAGARNSPNFDPFQFTPRIIVVEPGSAPGSGTTPPPASTAKTHDVKIGSGGFEPGSLSIKAGETVRWTNKDNSLHNVQTDDHSWGSPPLPSGAVWSRTFPQSGTVLYHCHFHHEMTARLTVNP